MKKLFLSAAVLAMLASCQNEVIVGQSEMQQGGEFVSLSISKGSESRTALGQNNATVWSAGDKIYVCGNNGKVTGELKLVSGANETSGTFEGYVFGGKQLDYVVFPVPQNGKINMGAREAGKLDAPMVGTINSNNNGETTASLNNVGGLLAIRVEGGAGQTLKVGATDGTNNMTGGSYTFNPSNGTLQYTPAAGAAETVVNTEGWAYVPVATTTTATNGTVASGQIPTSVTVAVTVTKVNADETETPISQASDIIITSGEIMGDGIDNEGNPDEASTGLDVSMDEEGNVAKFVYTAEELQAALNAGETQEENQKNIKLGANLSNLTKGFEVSAEYVVLDLNGKSIHVYGDDAFQVNAGSTLIIEGKNESIVETGGATNPGICTIWANGGSVIINGGYFKISKDNDGYRNDCIYAGYNRDGVKTAGLITINGGYFEYSTNYTLDDGDEGYIKEKDGDRYLLNCADVDAGEQFCQITVNGGNFKNHVPGRELCGKENEVILGNNKKVYKNNEEIVLKHSGSEEVWYTVR